MTEPKGSETSKRLIQLIRDADKLIVLVKKVKDDAAQLKERMNE